MPLQNFVDNNLPTIKAAWLNAVDAFYFTLFNSATTAAQARRSRATLLLSCMERLHTCGRNEQRQYIARFEGKVVQNNSHCRDV